MSILAVKSSIDAASGALLLAATEAGGKVAIAGAPLLAASGIGLVTGSTIAIPCGLGFGAGLGMFYLSKRVSDYFLGSSIKGTFYEEISELKVVCKNVKHLDEKIRLHNVVDAEIQQKLETLGKNNSHQNKLIEERDALMNQHDEFVSQRDALINRRDKLIQSIVKKIIEQHAGQR